MSGYLDFPGGNSSIPWLEKNVVSYPLSGVPNNSNVKVYDLQFVVASDSYAAATLGSNNNLAPNAFLVAESPIEKIGAGIVRYSRKYAEIPVTWYDIEQVFYSYPGRSNGTGFSYLRYGARKPITVPKLATANHSYFLNANVPTGNVQAVTIVLGNIMANNPQPVNWIGELSAQDNTNTVPATDPATWILSSDPVRWMGPIWEIVTKTVTAPNTFV